MKFLVTIAFLVSSVIAFAGEKYICIQTNGDEYMPKKIIITQIGEAKISEGKSYPFLLEIFQGNSSIPLVKETVFVRTEDVVFEFNNKAKKIDGIIFMDEPNEAGVNIGKEDINMNCN